MEINSDILEKYWSGRCSPEERRAVESWMAAGVPESEHALKTEAPEEEIREELWNRIRPGHAAGETLPQAFSGKSSFIRRLLYFTSAAAAVVVGVFVYQYAFFSSGLKKDNAEALQWREVSVLPGQKKRLILSDSSVVLLNSGSKFRFPLPFTGGERRVVLEGEGFFSVSKDPSRPFIVETARAEARVLGTRFNFRCFPGEEKTLLAVEEGSVQMKAKNIPDPLILIHDRQGIFDGWKLREADAAGAHYTAWTRGEIVFDRVTLAEALKELERWYGVSIRLKSPGLAGHRVKARFRNMPLEAVIHDLAFANNLKFSVKNKEVTLYQ